MNPIKRILIAIDLADSGQAPPEGALNTTHALRHRGEREVARRLIAEVVPLAQALRASVDIVYVRETRSHKGLGGNPSVDAVDDWIDQHLQELAGAVTAAGVSCITTSLQGVVHRELVTHTKKTNPDLVVLGSHGRWHLESCAEHVLLEAHQRILVVPVADRSDGQTSGST